MDYHLDHEIRLSEESKHKSLYSWSLQEFAKDGKQIGRDQIPWPWSLYFTASELRHKKSVSIERSNESPNESQKSNSAKVSESITAVLHPGICTDGKSLKYDTLLSMFGTKRTLDHINLHIYRLDDNDTTERCNLWGCLSYTSEVDFRDETEPDTIEIYISLSRKKFDELCDIVKDKNAEIFQVILSGVSGFYSEWSPSVSTDRVKILVRGEEQKVVLPEGCHIAPPKLGEVESFELTAVRRKKLNLKQDLTPTVVEKIFEEEHQDRHHIEEPGDEESSSGSAMLVQLLKNAQLIAKLSTPLWLIVILLVVLAFK